MTRLNRIDAPAMPPTWSIQSAAAPGAVAIIQLAADSASEVDAALDKLGLQPVPVGRVSLRDLCGIDRGLVARWAERSAHLMPHGGIAVVRAIVEKLREAGWAELRNLPPDQMYPEARSDLEARMLTALARAASPLAVDLLLDQPRRWAGLEPPHPLAAEDCARHETLARLLSPPLVVAIGPPNIGKSSLLNALAGRTAAIVADEPGTTRDHIGVHIDMAGLVVRYIDTPGVRDTADPIEREAAAIAAQLTARADLILSCGDVTAPPVNQPHDHPTLTIATRADLGRPSWPHDAAVSAATGSGLMQLVTLIREQLVPTAAITDPKPWHFWP